MKTLMAFLLSFAAMVAVHAPGAWAQTRGDSGSTFLTATAVTSVTDNTANRTIAFGLKLENLKNVVVTMQYAPASNPPLADTYPVDLAVKDFILKLVEAKRTNPDGYYGALCFNRVHFKTVTTLRGSTTVYTVVRETEFTLKALNPTRVNTYPEGDNTRGGLVDATVFAEGTRTIEGNMLSLWGMLTLRRKDGANYDMNYDFQCYPLAANGQIGNSTYFALSRNLTYSVDRLYNEVLAAPHMLVFERSNAPIKVNETRFIVGGTKWRTTP